ncbi:MAG: sigma-70 family RNA polymerase sigma factor [Candidatus Omnitrophica bacterium]|nr:sigma-70 family RNA polymerase sigma factor [Candidatus Omnitrophota bacterium]
MSNNADDKALVEAFMRGDREAFDKIVLKYQAMVYNLCCKMLGDHEEALDVSQDLFLKIYSSAGQFRGDAKFSTYLYAACVNLCRNRRKALSRRRAKQAFSIDDPIGTKEGPVKREIPDGKPTPREDAGTNERNRAVAGAIAALSDEYRETILLREQEGLSYEEIAAVLKVDIGTVKSRLSRAREMLSEKLRGIL